MKNYLLLVALAASAVIFTACGKDKGGGGGGTAAATTCQVYTQQYGCISIAQCQTYYGTGSQMCLAGTNGGYGTCYRPTNLPTANCVTTLQICQTSYPAYAASCALATNGYQQPYPQPYPQQPYGPYYQQPYPYGPYYPSQYGGGIQFGFTF